MRLNLFASSLILAASSAIEIVVPATDDIGAAGVSMMSMASSAAQVESMSEDDDNYVPLALAQTEASIWYSNGVHTSMYKRPEDHCCHIYLGSKFTEEEDEPLCYEKGAK